MLLGTNCIKASKSKLCWLKVFTVLSTVLQSKTNTAFEVVENFNATIRKKYTVNESEQLFKQTDVLRKSFFCLTRKSLSI